MLGLPAPVIRDSIRRAMAGMAIDVPRYSVIPPLPGFDGDVDDAVLYAGESCSLVRDIRPAAAIVREIVAEADAVCTAFGR